MLTGAGVGVGAVCAGVVDAGPRAVGAGGAGCVTREDTVSAHGTGGVDRVSRDVRRGAVGVADVGDGGECGDGDVDQGAGGGAG